MRLLLIVLLHSFICVSVVTASQVALPANDRDHIGYIDISRSGLVELAVDNIVKGVQNKNFNVIQDYLDNAGKRNVSFERFITACDRRAKYISCGQTSDVMVDFSIAIKKIDYMPNKAYVICEFTLMCSPELSKKDTLEYSLSGSQWTLMNIGDVLDFLSDIPRNNAIASRIEVLSTLSARTTASKTGYGTTFIQQNVSNSSMATFRRLSCERTQSLIQRKLFNDIYSSCTVYHYDPEYGYTNKIEVVTDPNWNRFVFGDYEQYLSSSEGLGNLKNPKGVTYARNGKYFIANSCNNSIAVYRHNMANHNSSVCYLGEISVINGQSLSLPTDVYADNNGTWKFTGQSHYNAEADDWLWIVDSKHNRICKTVIEAGQVGYRDDFVYGSYGTGVGQFNNPKAIAVGKKTYYWRPYQGSWDSVLVTVNSKDVYVVDHGNHRIVWLEKTYDSNPDNDPYTQYTHIVKGVVWKGIYQGTEQSDFYSIETDGFGNVYVADRANCQILKLDKYLNFIYAYGSPGTGQNNDNTFWYPIHVNNPLYTYVSPLWLTWVPLSTDVLLTSEKWTDQSGGLRHQLGIDVIDYNAVLAGYDLYYTFRLTDYAKVTVTAACSDGSSLTLLNNVAVSPGMYYNMINAGKVITSMTISARSFYKKSDGTPTVQIQKSFAPATMPNDSWYVESSGDTVHTSVNCNNTSGSGAELVLHVDSTITPGSWFGDYPCLRKNIITPVIAIDPNVDMNIHWTQRDYDHALHFELLIKGEDNVNRWLIYAPNAPNHWNEAGYVNMGEGGENYTGEELFERNLSLDYYITFNHIKPVQIEGMRLAHFYFSGWPVGNHGGYVKDISFSDQASTPVLVQNQLIDQGNRTDIGTVYCIDAYHQSPYTTGMQTAIGDQLYVEANDPVDYPAGVQNVFCGWNDGGAKRHAMGTPISGSYTAYYKKRPYLSGNANLLSWDWLPESRPPSFQRFELYRGGVGKIWEGTANTQSVQVVSGKAFFAVYAVVNIGGVEVRISSNDISVIRNIDPNDPGITDAVGRGATAYSNGKKLALSDQGRLYVTYTSGDTVYYAASADDGATWSGFTPVGYGSNPAIVLRTSMPNDGGAATQIPSICYVNGSNLYLSDMAANGAWAGTQSIYQGQPDEEISYLSYVLNRQDNQSYMGWVSNTPSGSQVNIAPYAPGSQGQLSPSPIDQGGQTAFKSPSMVLDKQGSLIAAWSRDGLVKYSDPDGGTIELSSPENYSIHPIVSTYGDRTSVTWMEQTAPAAKNEPGKYRIVTRERTAYGWSDPQVVSCPDSGDAQFPVAAANGQYIYTKETGDGDYDINYFGSYANGWEAQVQNLSRNAGGQSYYPDVVFRPSWPNHKLYIVWTEADTANPGEKTSPLARVKFLVRSIDPVPSFGVYPSIETASPYTTRRAGALYFGAGRYQTVDYDSSKLTYHFGNLDPDMKYQVKAVYYRDVAQEGKGGHRDDWRQTLKADQITLVNSWVPETTAVKVAVLIPKHCYRDGQVDISIERKKGDYAICAGLELIAYEDEKGGHRGGGQLETTSRPLSCQFKLMQSMPNPSTGNTTIGYQIAAQTHVSLKVYNTLGQVVRTLVDDVRQPGAYQAVWNGKDNSGKSAAAGVYLYRLISGEKTDTKKMVVVR